MENKDKGHTGGEQTSDTTDAEAQNKVTERKWNDAQNGDTQLRERVRSLTAKIFNLQVQLEIANAAQNGDMQKKEPVRFGFCGEDAPDQAVDRTGGGNVSESEIAEYAVHRRDCQDYPTPSAEELGEQVRSLEEVLRYYANHENWSRCAIVEGEGDHRPHFVGKVCGDGGVTARDALKARSG